jgi:nucleotide-binding universal stress UspA family protein
MFEKILVPLDGSELAEEVLHRVVELSKKLGSTVVLVQAIDSLSQRLVALNGIEPAGAVAANVEAVENAIDAEKDAAEAYLTRMKAHFTSEGLPVETFLGEGQPVEVILDLAEKEGAGLIAMTTHGRGGLGRLVFGSVSDAVLRHSNVPVLLLRSTEKEK